MKKTIIKAFSIVGGIVLAVAILAGILYLVVTHDYSGNPPVSVETCTNLYISKTGKPMISAHRSGAGIAPENTMLAFKTIIENNESSIDIFEFDIQLTKDNELILLHDETLDRTSNAVEVFGKENVKASELTYEELRQLNMGENFMTPEGSTPYRGLRGDDIPENLRIVRLGNVLEYLSDFGDFNFIIELKDENDLGRQATDQLYQLLTKRGLLKRAIIGTFHEEITAYMENTYPDMERSASIREVIGFYIDSLLNINRPNDHYKFVALQIPDDDYIVKLGTTRLINYAHKHNIAVQYWTINDEDNAKELMGKGADAIMSDFPDMLYRVFYGGVS